MAAKSAGIRLRPPACACASPRHNSFRPASHLLACSRHARCGVIWIRHAPQSLFPAPRHDAVLGRQRRRRQAGDRPCVAHAAFGAALGARHGGSGGDRQAPPGGGLAGAAAASQAADAARPARLHRVQRGHVLRPALHLGHQCQHRAGLHAAVRVRGFLRDVPHARDARPVARLPAFLCRGGGDGDPWRDARAASSRHEFRRRADAAGHRRLRHLHGSAAAAAEGALDEPDDGAVPGGHAGRGAVRSRRGGRRRHDPAGWRRPCRDLLRGGVSVAARAGALHPRGGADRRQPRRPVHQLPAAVGRGAGRCRPGRALPPLSRSGAASGAGRLFAAEISRPPHPPPAAVRRAGRHARHAGSPLRVTGR